MLGGWPAGEESEIIEIGVCPLEIATGKLLEKRSILIKPTRSHVSPFCTELTTLTPEMLKSGISFVEACSILRKEYQSRERLWGSYGDYDRRQFERQCAAQGVGYPFGTSHLNVKTLFALSWGLPNEVGMSEARSLLKMPLEGTHHRGGDDAWNIAGILREILAFGRTNLRSRGDS